MGHSMFRFYHCLVSNLAFAVASAALLYVPVAEASETVVHTFQDNGSDGTSPQAGLISVARTLYGTTKFGGTGTCSNFGGSGCGTVFSLNPATGSEKVLHSFTGTDGSGPTASLIAVRGELYGTTAFGGAGACDFFGSGCGTVFSVNPKNGTEKVLHSFSGSDGADISANLIAVRDVLYGTAAYGGTGTCSNSIFGPGCGTVFSVNLKTGAEKVLHSFQNNGTDGADASAGLINLNGTLYGTTSGGGTGTCSSVRGSGCGTVFSVNPKTGVVKVLYSFQGGSTDGAYPSASLIDVNGTLYGTTTVGGTGTCSNVLGPGCGTVFSVNPETGSEKVLYSFQNNDTDGTAPLASLTDFKGTLYGTTSVGGAGTCTSNLFGRGCGTVFSINAKSGAEKVQYAFQDDSDSEYPDAGLVAVNGSLYGTTSSNDEYGSDCTGSSCGSVFAIKR
jgi:uncharacterized repeat protein (TIGR03803 family)